MAQDDALPPTLVMEGAPRRPFGRALGDFRLEGQPTPHGLYPAEEKLLAAVRLGELCAIGSQRPEQAANASRVRGSFIRFLALGGDERAPVHEKGVQLCGAYIAEPLDLQGCLGVRPLGLCRCWFDSALVLRDAQAGFLQFDDSRIPGLSGDHLQVASDFCLRGCNAEGEVRLGGAEIGGNLECDGGTFRNRTDDGRGAALTCDGARIAGNVLLRGTGEKQFRAEGALRFRSAEIGGYFDCGGAALENRTADGRGLALDCGRAKIAGDVFLSGAEAPFSALGAVRLAGSEIGGDVDCANGTFDNFVPDPASTDAHGRPESAAFALTLDRARVLGTLWLGPAAPPHGWPVTIHGSLDLRGCYAHHVLDHPSTWPKPPASPAKAATGGTLACTIALDNFTYDRFVGRGQYDATTRTRWLLRQAQRHLGEDFRPQPFAQLIKVLHEMGREDDARRIAVFKQRMRRRAGWGKLWRGFARRPKRWWGWIGSKPAAAIATLAGAIGLALQWLFFDFLLGGGYAKAKPIALFALMLIGGALYYEQAANRGAIVPVNSALANDPQVRMACTGTKEPPPLAAPINWHRCRQAPADLNHFNPWVYSLDLMLPLIQLGQKRDWQPASVFVAHEPWGFVVTPTQVITYGQQILSLVLYLLIAAIVSGIIKRE